MPIPESNPWALLGQCNNQLKAENQTQAAKAIETITDHFTKLIELQAWDEETSAIEAKKTREAVELIRQSFASRMAQAASVTSEYAQKFK